MRRPVIWLTASLLTFSGPAFLAQEPAAGQTRSSKIWLGRNAEFEEFLRTAEIERTSGTAVGVMAPRHAHFKAGGLAAGAAVKPIPPRTSSIGCWT
jgi:hypothetical protein